MTSESDFEPERTSALLARMARESMENCT